MTILNDRNDEFEPLNYDDLDNGDHDKHEKVIHIWILRSTCNSFYKYWNDLETCMLRSAFTIFLDF